MTYENKIKGIKYIDTANGDFSKNANLTVVSLFSGAGGIDIGLEGAGFETKVCIENDEDCRATLKFNRPEWNVFDDISKMSLVNDSFRKPGDIRDIEVEEILNAEGLEVGETTLVVGGAPCQPFSNIGKKLGQEDEKNGDLFLEFVRMVKGMLPQGFIFENVAGITQAKHSDVIQYMVKQFEGLGYGLSYTILNAADYGVPQKRERFFLIGIKGIQNPAFPLPTHFKDETAFNAFKSHTACNNHQFRKWVSVNDTFSKLPKELGNRTDHAVMKISETVVQRMKLIEQGQNFKVLPDEMKPNCWKNGKHQGNDTFGRIVGEMPSLTIRTAAYNPSKGMYIHPDEDRGLNTIEMAALQSFPMNWEFRSKSRDKITLVSGGKQIGNAVPPLLAEVLGKAIRLQLRTNEGLKQKHDLHLAEY